MLFIGEKVGSGFSDRPRQIPSIVEPYSRPEIQDGILVGGELPKSGPEQKFQCSVDKRRACNGKNEIRLVLQSGNGIVAYDSRHVFRGWHLWIVFRHR
jgi:hypothetical protein